MISYLSGGGAQPPPDCINTDIPVHEVKRSWEVPFKAQSDFLSEGCYSFGIPLLQSVLAYEEGFHVEFMADLLKSELRNLKGASLRLYPMTST